MAITALYRISSKEVIKISIKGQLFSSSDPVYWGVLTDPSLPDGNIVRETLPDGTLGPLRQLGFAKIADVGGSEVRDAIQSEIDTFAGFQTTDENLQDRDEARDFTDVHPRFRKFIIAFADIIKDEINILRSQHGLSNRTLGQLKTALRNRISEDD